MLTIPTISQTKTHPLVTTGGTISAGSDDSGALVAGVNSADKFRSLIKEDLAKSNIAISPANYAPYAILSENINLTYVEKLVDELIKVIKTENPELIVVAHGTDSMDKVAKLLDYPVDETLNEKISEDLAEKIIELQDLIGNRGIYITFTGSNTNNEDEIKANLQEAFESLEKLRKRHPGIYISFHGDLIRGKHAVKDIYDPELNGMRYADSRDANYKTKVELQNQRDAAIISNLETKIQSRKIADNPTLQDYDVTQIYPDHSQFKAKIDERTKAILLYVYHGGTANTDSENPEISVEQLVKDLRQKYPNLVFFAATENFEPTDLKTYETSRKLLDAGIVPLYDMSKNVALAKLQMLQLENMKSTAIIDEMLNPKAKEIDLKRINRDDIGRIKTSYAASA